MNLKLPLKNKNKRDAIHVVVIIALYFIIFNYVSQKDIVSTLLTAGNQASTFDLILCLFFIVLRFFTLVLLPGILLAMVGSLVMEYIVAKTKAHEKLQD
ncbi:MAG: hypothetical protein WCS96_00210 [Victivallales bacterium]|jgi:hypothetical protein